MLVFLPAWGALINGAVMLFGGRCFFTAMAGPDEWHSLFPGWAASIGVPSPYSSIFHHSSCYAPNAGCV